MPHAQSPRGRDLQAHRRPPRGQRGARPYDCDDQGPEGQPDDGGPPPGSRERGAHQGPPDHASGGGELGQGRGRQVDGEREPGGRAGRAGLQGRAARRRHLGFFGPTHAWSRGSSGGR